MKKLIYIICILSSLILSSCYHHPNKEERLYDIGYNFVVSSDSMMMMMQEPEEIMVDLLSDTLYVYEDDRLVVADVRVIPGDEVDSVWVQIARDQETIGWLREKELLESVTPDDPISMFISTFSDIHIIVFLVVMIIIGTAYMMRHILKRGVPIVHFHDIASAYPTLLTVTVAASATFYASIQMFAPETWQHFYYHPTLNPFSVPPILEIFLLSVWLMLILALASLDDVRKILPFTDAILYLGGLVAVCAVNYLLFSILTLYYIGYPLLVAYVLFAFYRHLKHNRTKFVCGNCGARLSEKSRCPRCGAINN